MSELDGIWNVERTGGALPPLYAFRKHIVGTRGSTRVGRLPLPFDVRGNSLHYRFPPGLVDHLEPSGDEYRGRATLYGRELGRFVMRRMETNEGGTMATEELKSQLVKHIDEALAMEQNVLRMLDSMIASTPDQEIKDGLRHHKLETEQQVDRLTQRLEAHGSSPSVVREATGIMGALTKSVLDAVRGEKAGRNARDGYATEHMEIASYQLLERIAQRAGDEETAAVARQNRAEEEKMAEKIEQNWDKYAELSLQEAGVPV